MICLKLFGPFLLQIQRFIRPAIFVIFQRQVCAFRMRKNLPYCKSGRTEKKIIKATYPLFYFNCIYSSLIN